MPENWSRVAADVVAAIADVGFDITITRTVSGPTTPGDTTAYVPSTLYCKAIDRKPKTMRLPGTAELITMRSIFVAPGSVVPVMGDILTMRGVAHQAGQVHTVAPGGVDLLHIVEIAT